MRSAEVLERIVDIDAQTVRVLERGHGPVATVLLHGGLAGHEPWPGSADVWRLVLERWPGDRVVAIDLPGAGGSRVTGVEELTIAAMTGRVAAALAALGVTAAIPVGHGEASLIALRLARMAPDGLAVPAAAVVAATGAAPTSDGVPPLALAQPPARQSDEAQIRWALNRLSWAPGHITPDVVSALAVQAVGPGRHSAAVALAAAGAPERLEADLLASKMELFAFARDAGYETPLTIIWAAEDPLLGVDHGDALFALLATSQAELSFSVLPRVGHLLFREDPAAFIRALGPFAARAADAAAEGTRSAGVTP